MSGIVFFGDLPETPSWALQPPACFQLVHDSEFPALGAAAAKQTKPLTVSSFKRPVAEPKPKQSQQPAPLTSEQIHRAHVIDESARAIQLALTNPRPKHVDPKSQRSAAVCNLQTRMQFMRSSSGSSFTSDVCPLPKHIDISKCGDWSKLAAEVSVQLHAALVQQCGRDDFTVSVRFGIDKKAKGAQLHNVRGTVMW
jgi:hypothetical protein